MSLPPGNAGPSASGYQRDFYALMVTANDKAGKHAAFGQNADTKWALSAPGVAVYTTAPTDSGSYDTVNGTSFSSPHVAGAALLFSLGLPVNEVVNKLLGTARPMGDSAVNGAGLLDVAAAAGVIRSAANPAPVAPVTTTTTVAGTKKPGNGGLGPPARR